MTVAIDIARVDWFDVFFAKVVGRTVDEVLEGIKSLDVESLEETGDLAELAMSGWAYWTLYIRGYLDYSDCGRVTPDNLYLQYLVRYFGPRGHDPGLHEVLLDEEAARARVMLRYRDFDTFRLLGPDRQGEPAIDPVVLTVVNPPGVYAKVLYEAGSGQALPLAIVDGYHRVFLACLFGATNLQAQVVVASEPPL